MKELTELRSASPAPTPASTAKAAERLQRMIDDEYLGRGKWRRTTTPLLTRRRMGFLAPVAIGIANVGQAAPAIGRSEEKANIPCALITPSGRAGESPMRPLPTLEPVIRSSNVTDGPPG